MIEPLLKLIFNPELNFLYIFIFVLFVVAVFPSFSKSYDMFSKKRKTKRRGTSNGF